MICLIRMHFVATTISKDLWLLLNLSILKKKKLLTPPLPLQLIQYVMVSHCRNPIKTMAYKNWKSGSFPVAFYREMYEKHSELYIFF